jgi:hypothetical protein
MTTPLETQNVPTKKRGRFRALRWLLILAGAGSAGFGFVSEDPLFFWVGLMALGLGIVWQVLAMLF